MIELISISIRLIIILLIIVALSTFERKINVISRLFKAMNTAYKRVFDSSGGLMCCICGLIIWVFFLIAFQKCCLENGGSITGKRILFTIIVWILTSGIMYFLIGSILVLFFKTVDIIGNIKNDKISTKMMISFLILSFFIFFSEVLENEIKKNLILLFLGAGICYVLNIQIFLKIVQNPFCLVGGKKQDRSENRVLIIFTAILILLMFVADMYLLVLWSYYLHDGAYCCSTGDKVVTKWKLLYYTIISFTTIGYGDISPAIFESQAVAILIAITSVLCLVVFVSSVLSEKNEILNNEEDSLEGDENKR